uniref:30S ribosomal protein S18 n=1 Tax=Ascoseira mirabilis TaxID=76830 RepID=UPI003002DDB2|nr:30S ribosomal protein S18 [Ascoseira mirabilis]
MPKLVQMEKGVLVSKKGIQSNNEKKGTQSNKEKKGTQSNKEKKGTQSNKEKKGTQSNKEKKGIQSNKEKKGIQSNNEKKGTQSNKEKKGNKEKKYIQSKKDKKDKKDKPKFIRLNSNQTISYKQIDLLVLFLTENGKIKPRYLTSLTLKQQRQLSKSVKRARFLNLLSFVTANEDL